MPASTARHAAADPVSEKGAGHDSNWHSNPVFPQELMDMIVDNVDAPTLHVVALVSRACAKSTARRLFAARRWPKCEHYWTKRRKISEQCFCKSESTLLPHLSASLQCSERICSALRSITFNFSRAPGGRRPEGSGSLPMGGVNLDELLDVLALIPNLRRVALSGIFGHTSAERDRAVGWEQRTLEVLEISDVVHLDRESCADLVAFFCSVTQLVLKNTEITLPEDRIRYGNSIDRRTRVASITLARCTPPSVAKYLDAFRHVFDLASLTNLAVGIIGDNAYVEILADFLDHAVHLESFELCVRFHLPSPTREIDRVRLASDWELVDKLIDHCSAKNLVVGVYPSTNRPRQLIAGSMLMGGMRSFFQGVDWTRLRESVVYRQLPDVLTVALRLDSSSHDPRDPWNVEELVEAETDALISRLPRELRRRVNFSVDLR